MNRISEIRKTSIWIFIIPILVINLCLFISINYLIFENTIFNVDQIGRIGFTIPYIDGGVSISRTARTYPTYLIFKPGMIITSILLIKYWIANNDVIKKIDVKNQKNKSFLIFGVASAIFLIIHSIFLGIHFEYDLYKFFRRFIILGFIVFEMVAQTLLVVTIYKLKNEISNFINKKVLTLKIILVSTLIIIAIGSLPILSASGNTAFKHALEWDYFMGVLLFYLLTYFFWKEK